ncbi:MAG: hypothetical protein AB7V27_17335 [Candidatus Binatia bacterium]
MNSQTGASLSAFATRCGLEGLTAPSLRAIRAHSPGYTIERGRHFLQFHRQIRSELLSHQIITANRYTAWFRRGEQTLDQVRALVVQFSVFSNLFLVAQLYKTINADSLAGMRASKEILANEIGVVFRPQRPQARAATDDADLHGDPRLVTTEGTVEGGVFRFQAAHFEWLLRLAEALGLGFGDIGQRRHGTPGTLHFCDELVRLYGSPDYQTSHAASYAVENWAAAGFWKELIGGLTEFNRRHQTHLPLAFFTWHDRLEDQHAQHTQDELEALYFTRGLDERHFIRCGNEMLDGVAAFWEGLEEQRRALAAGPARLRA